MKRIIYIAALIAIVGFFNACTKDLDTTPTDPDVVTSGNAFDDPNAYTQFLAKCYVGLATGGNEGDGAGDVAGIDGGFSPYMRQLWYHQELTTDEAVIAWEDQTIKDFHYQQWGTSDVFVNAMYSRIIYQVSLTNEFMRQTSDDVLSDRGVSAEWKTKVDNYRLEARFLRALSYWHGLDLFGGTIFVTEADPLGDPDFYPPRVSAEDMFNFIESECLEIADQMMPARTNEYGRADQVAAWTLLAKLYLNAEVYIGQNKYTECVTYSNKIIESSYALAPTWEQLFWANNDMDDATMQEIIFPVRFDGSKTRTNGGTTFISNACMGGNMVTADYGFTGDNAGWGGTRVTPEFVGKFDDNPDDARAVFFTDGQNISIEDVNVFTDGYAYPKFVNYYIVDGEKINGGDPDGNFSDTDFPLFRMADVYLMYAEAVERGGGGGNHDAVALVNQIRERAGVPVVSSLGLDFILDERGRELAWECHRRTDLVRFGKFSQSDYVWQWKGNVKQGQSTSTTYNVFPIPASEINSNPTIDQNPGY